MCGVVGILRPGGTSTVACERTVSAMAARLSHRGPDDAGTWIDSSAGVALGHRRLAVLDLSPAGHQPMSSASGRYVIAFNGEIYNHLEIRGELERAAQPATWRGRSDTETLLAAFDRWGIESTLGKTVGMFAIALWDRRSRTLTLARDRLGEKPLFYGWQENVFLFGSELKALRAHPAFRAEIDRDALSLYMQRGYVGAPRCIYRGIFKVPPGSVVQVCADAPACTPVRTRTYWSLRQVAEAGLASPLKASDAELIDLFEATLSRAVRDQTIADVPIGAFLSGGIDSTAVVALLQRHGSQTVSTFTVGFREAEYQEAQHAAAVARHLGTDHTELYVTARETMEVIPQLPEIYDEPLGDSSAIPTHLVARLARRHVTVCLSGDGGDELLGGYARYGSTARAWSAMRRVPRPVRRALSFACRAYARRDPASLAAWKAKRLGLYLSAASADECYAVNVLQHQDAPNLVLLPDAHGAERERYLPPVSELSAGSMYERMMFADSTGYLPDDILAKVDRAAMAVSLETRIPLLDHRLVELAWRIPLRLKVRRGQTKWLLKQVLYRHVPERLMRRPKMGFGVPVNDWVREPLRDWAEDLLSESRLRAEGFLNPSVVRERWQRHLERKSDEGDALWQVLVFQAWLSASGRMDPMRADFAA